VSSRWLQATVFWTLLFLTKSDLIVLVLIEFSHSLQIPHLRPAEYKRSRLSRNRRTVNRAYGGVLSGSAVRERYATLIIYCFVVFWNWLRLALSVVSCVYSTELSGLSWWRSKRLWRRFWRFRRQRKNRPQNDEVKSFELEDVFEQNFVMINDSQMWSWLLACLILWWLGCVHFTFCQFDFLAYIWIDCQFLCISCSCLLP